MSLIERVGYRAACLSFLLLAAFAVTPAHAGAVYVYLFVDPPTTAGAGVPASNGFNVVSNRFGAGSWHLYAIDDADNSLGIRSYNVKFNGTITAVNHRSPTTSWDDVDNTGPYNAGFSDIRSGSNVTPVIASQSVLNTPAIGGFGQEASDFRTKIGGATYAGTVNGQWGNYGDGSFSTINVPATGHVRHPLFLAEGLYSGAAPTVDITTPVDNGGTGFALWNPGFQGSFVVAAGTSQALVNTTPYIPEPATLTLAGLATIGLSGLVGRRRT